MLACVQRRRNSPRDDPGCGPYPSTPGSGASPVTRTSRPFGDGVPSAEVCASWRTANLPEWLGPWRRCAETRGESEADRGVFNLRGLPSRSVEVMVEAPGYEAAAREVDPGRLSDGRAVFALEVAEEADQADPGPSGVGAVRVEVVGANGEPIERFLMHTRAVGRLGGSTRQVDAAGEPLSLPVDADYASDAAVTVTFEAEGYLPSEGIPVVPIPGGEVDLGLVVLERGAAVQGVLFDTVGAAPVPGCLVELLLPGAGAIRTMLMGERHRAVADEDGHFLLGGLGGGRYRLRVHCLATPMTDRLVVVEPDEWMDLGESWLHAGRRVSVRTGGLDAGVVRLLDRYREVESPIVESLLRPVGASADEGLRAVSELKAAPGVYRLEVLDREGALRISQEVRVDESVVAEVQTIEVAVAERVIRSVLAIRGHPVSGGSVRFNGVLDISRSSGKIQIVSRVGDGARNNQLLGLERGPVLLAGVGPAGSFEVAGAPEGLLWMTWYAPDGRASAGRLWPDGVVSLMDLNGTRLAGELRDQHGAPIEGRVALVGDLGREVVATHTYQDGRFSLLPVPPGRYRLTARPGASSSPPGRQAQLPLGAISREIMVAAESPPHHVLRLDVPHTGQLDVTLSRQNGSPVAGAWLHLIDSAGDAVGTGLTAEDGRFRDDDVPAGDITVVWNDGASCVGGEAVTVEAERTVRLSRSLPLGRLLVLRCPAVHCGGEPLSFLSVTTLSGAEIAAHLTGAGEAVRFSEFGRLGLGCVTPGSYTVSFWAAGRRWSAQATVGSKGSAENPVVVEGREA